MRNIPASLPGREGEQIPAQTHSFKGEKKAPFEDPSSCVFSKQLEHLETDAGGDAHGWITNSHSSSPLYWAVLPQDSGGFSTFTAF